MAKLREKTREERGFSLIELLVVVMIIGLLAAIAIAAFTNQQGKAGDVEAKSGVQTAARALETCGTENDDHFDKPGSPCDKAELIEIEPTLADLGTRLQEPALSPMTYTITVQSERAPNEVTFSVERLADGTFHRACTVGNANKGGCPRPGAPGPDW